MSQENVERVRLAYEAFGRGDLTAAVADLAPKVEYVTGAGIPGVTGVARGPDGYIEMVRWLTDLFDDYQLTIEELLDAGDRVFGGLTLSGRGRRSGAETSLRMWQVWKVHEGKLTHGQGFTDRDVALAAAGLSD
jgi:ketosteroid isomerase-like protein